MTRTADKKIVKAYVAFVNPYSGWDLYFVTTKPFCRRVANFASREAAFKTKNDLMRSRVHEGPQSLLR